MNPKVRYHLPKALLWTWVAIIFYSCRNAGASCYFFIPALVAAPHWNELRKLFVNFLKDSAK